MKININAEMEGTEIVELFLKKLSENNVISEGQYPNNGPHTKFNVQNKSGDWVDISVDKVKLVFNRS